MAAGPRRGDRRMPSRLPPGSATSRCAFLAREADKGPRIRRSHGYSVVVVAAAMTPNEKPDGFRRRTNFSSEWCPDAHKPGTIRRGISRHCARARGGSRQPPRVESTIFKTVPGRTTLYIARGSIFSPALKETGNNARRRISFATARSEINVRRTRNFRSRASGRNRFVRSSYAVA